MFALVLVSLIYFAITSFALWGITMCLRTGTLTLRNGQQLARDESPVIFWAVMLFGLFALVALLGVGLRMANQFIRTGSVTSS